MEVERVPRLRVVIVPKVSARGVPVVWNFLFDVPEIEIVAGPNSPDWPKRVKAEIDVFERWRKIYPNLPFRGLKWIRGGLFEVEVNVKELFGRSAPDGRGWLRVHIGVGRTYPFGDDIYGLVRDPRWAVVTDDDRLFLRMLADFAGMTEPCIPPVWYEKFKKLKGKAGIAHFLLVFLLWLSVIRTYRSRRE